MKIFHLVNNCDIEKYLKIEQQHGLIYSDGKPQRCICGSKDFEKYNEDWHDQHFILEYSLKCKKCERTLGNWSYGNWML